MDPNPVVLGIDVGGPAKGFHGVAIRDGALIPRQLARVENAVAWALELRPAAIAIDAPAGWAGSGRSRACERELRIHGQRIQSFHTPTQEHAAGNPFYDWVRHGLELYAALAPHFRMFSGGRPGGPVMCETFPHAVACWLSGHHLPARHKSPRRRAILSAIGHSADRRALPNIDFVDAALCAVTAIELTAGRFHAFGDPGDGWIVVPKLPLAQDGSRRSLVP